MRPGRRIRQQPYYLPQLLVSLSRKRLQHAFQQIYHSCSKGPPRVRSIDQLVPNYQSLMSGARLLNSLMAVKLQGVLLQGFLYIKNAGGLSRFSDSEISRQRKKVQLSSVKSVLTLSQEYDRTVYSMVDRECGKMCQAAFNFLGAAIRNLIRLSKKQAFQKIVIHHGPKKAILDQILKRLEKKVMVSPHTYSRRNTGQHNKTQREITIQQQDWMFIDQHPHSSGQFNSSQLSNDYTKTNLDHQRHNKSRELNNHQKPNSQKSIPSYIIRKQPQKTSTTVQEKQELWGKTSFGKKGMDKSTRPYTQRLQISMANQIINEKPKTYLRPRPNSSHQPSSEITLPSYSRAQINLEQEFIAEEHNVSSTTFKQSVMVDTKETLNSGIINNSTFTRKEQLQKQKPVDAPKILYNPKLQQYKSVNSIQHQTVPKPSSIYMPANLRNTYSETSAHTARNAHDQLFTSPQFFNLMYSKVDDRYNPGRSIDKSFRATTNTSSPFISQFQSPNRDYKSFYLNQEPNRSSLHTNPGAAGIPPLFYPPPPNTSSYQTHSNPLCQVGRGYHSSHPATTHHITITTTCCCCCNSHSKIY